MRSLIETILTLPPLPLDANQLQSLSNIISSLPPEDFDNIDLFNQALATKMMPTLSTLFWSKTVTLIMTYLKAWFELGIEVARLDTKIRTTWYSITKKTIGNDQIIPITIMLTPKSLSQLRLVKAKLQTAADLDIIHQTGFLLTNLFSSISYVIEKLETNNPLDDESFKDKLLIGVVTKINTDEDQWLVDKLNKVFEQYKMQHSISDDQSVLIDDLIITLKRAKNSPRQILIEFSEKFFILFPTQPITKTSHLYYFTSFLYSKEPQQQETFFRMVGGIANWIREENEMVEIVQKPSFENNHSIPSSRA